MRIMPHEKCAKRMRNYVNKHKSNKKKQVFRILVRTEKDALLVMEFLKEPPNKWAIRVVPNLQWFGYYVEVLV